MTKELYPQENNNRKAQKEQQHKRHGTRNKRHERKTFWTLNWRFFAAHPHTQTQPHTHARAHRPWAWAQVRRNTKVNASGTENKTTTTFCCRSPNLQCTVAKKTAIGDPSVCVCVCVSVPGVFRVKLQDSWSCIYLADTKRFAKVLGSVACSETAF